VYDRSSGGLPIAYIAVVGFHHRRGPELDWIYPNVDGDGKKCGEPSLEPVLDSELPFLALPETAHDAKDGVDYVYFSLLPDGIDGHPLMCVSCYMHVDASIVHNEKDVSRAAVQKAVVLITVLPFLSALRERLTPAARAYCNQMDFTDRQILVDFFNSVNAIRFEEFNSSQLYHELQLKPLIGAFREGIVQVLKLMILEAKIIVYSSEAHRAATTVLTLMSMMPGLLDAGFHSTGLHALQFEHNTRGLPLKIFHAKSRVQPYMSIYQLHLLSKLDGFLVGTSNMMLVKVSGLLV
jgi:hypothetical protein